MGHVGIMSNGICRWEIFFVMNGMFFSGADDIVEAQEPSSRCPQKDGGKNGSHQVPQSIAGIFPILPYIGAHSTMSRQQSYC